MSDMNRTSFLELDDAPVKLQPNTSVFSNAGGFQVADGATAKQDANGSYGALSTGSLLLNSLYIDFNMQGIQKNNAIKPSTLTNKTDT